MKQTEYLAERNRLTEETLGRLSVHNDDTLNRTLNFVSANLRNFIPQIDVGTHEMLFRHMLLQQKLSWLDLEFPAIFDHISYENSNIDAFEFLKTQPSIICTFHLGSFRLINYVLGKNGINYTLMVSDAALKEHQHNYQKIYEQHNYYAEGEKFNIISAQSPHSGMQMLRELKKGKSLLVYIDGYSGAGNNTIQNENLLKINFLAESIYARKGIAYFSHLAKVPIVAVANYRKTKDDLCFKFFDPIFPNLTMDREIYATHTTQKIFDQFAELLLKYPEQWEAWLYLHSVIKPHEFSEMRADGGADKNEDRLYFNKNKFGLFSINQEMFLFNKRNYNSFPLKEPIYSLLNKSTIHPVSKAEFPASIFDQLINNQVLT